MKLLLLAVVLIVVVFIRFSEQEKPARVVQSSKEEQSNKDLLLPDLKLSPPRQLYITSDSGKKEIRFTTTFVNQGKGPLEVLGKTDLEKNKTKASQRILKTDGNFKERELGEFIFHPGHEHWHIEKYSLFEIWSVKEKGKKDKLLATTSKMSFCLWDEEAFDLNLENASQTQKYVGCNNEIQGVSVGWSDTYEASVEGQQLDITSLADGLYILLFVVNPDRKILEGNYDNNEVLLRVRIDNDSLTIL